MKPVYLDCNATTPIEPQVAEVVRRLMELDFGNPASPVHEFGTFARMAVEKARAEISEVVGAKRDEVIFTSGATEANNLVILGLEPYGRESGRRHIITTAVEHKAVLEPVERLASEGFDVDIIQAGENGRIDPSDLRAALRPDTLLVSVMHVNNETGIIQPLDEIASILEGHPALLHTDAAQGFGKDIESLRNMRLDLISISGHKIYGPKGIGALVARKREGLFPPMKPLMFGGGQEQGLRPGTLPSQLIAGLGTASRLALRNHKERREKCLEFRRKLLDALAPVGAVINGNPDFSLPHTVNIAIPKVHSDLAIESLKELVAISSTSACTSHTRASSHVLGAMGIPRNIAGSSVRLSWCHMTPDPDWDAVVSTIKSLQA